MHMDRPTIVSSSSSDRISVYGEARAAMGSRRNFPACSHYSKNVALEAPDPRIDRVAQARGIFGHRVEHRLNRRVRDDAQHLRGGSLLLHRLDKALTRLGNLPSARFELLFVIGTGLARPTTTRLRFCRMKLAIWRSALRPFARQGHLRCRPLERDGRSAAGRTTSTARRSRSSNGRACGRLSRYTSDDPSGAASAYSITRGVPGSYSTAALYCRVMT